MEYKWVVLSNTTFGVFMASIDINIVLIALPAIFRGIQLDPLTSFPYLIWLLFGYSIVTATLLVTFGRISDIYGRVKLYNRGFAIYTVGSFLLYLTPHTGDLGALELIAFRVVQAVGGAFLFSNSAALISDAFPPSERGKALGINQIGTLAGSSLGLVIGGILAAYDWRWVFLISVPFGIYGTAWSYLKLRELAPPSRGKKVDYWGNASFGIGLTLMVAGVTYGLLPYDTSSMGWGNPYVIAALALGAILVVAFPFIETKVTDPMFQLSLFRNRAFAAGNLAAFLASIVRGGVTLILIILLQGIWLPLHGVDYADTPLWASIYILPLTLGFVTLGPLSGYLLDRSGARGLSTVGMVFVAISCLGLTTLPYDFDYPTFGVLLFLLGAGLGIFSSPNTALIMNSVPAEHRGAASGMRSSIQNVGVILGVSLMFTLVILRLSDTLPAALASAAATSGAPQLGPVLEGLPPTSVLFDAFLGYNPMGEILAQLPPAFVATIPPAVLAGLTSQTWFPNAVAGAFMTAMDYSLYPNAALAIVAIVAAFVSGSRHIHDTRAPVEDRQLRARAKP